MCFFFLLVSGWWNNWTGLGCDNQWFVLLNFKNAAAFFFLIMHLLYKHKSNFLSKNNSNYPSSFTWMFPTGAKYQPFSPIHPTNTTQKLFFHLEESNGFILPCKHLWTSAGGSVCWPPQSSDYQGNVSQKWSEISLCLTEHFLSSIRPDFRCVWIIFTAVGDDAFMCARTSPLFSSDRLNYSRGFTQMIYMVFK